jgi:hypothetical protein
MKNRYILKLHYVINHIIVEIHNNCNFLIRRVVKVGTKNQNDKYLGIDGVLVKMVINNRLLICKD